MQERNLRSDWLERCFVAMRMLVAVPLCFMSSAQEDGKMEREGEGGMKRKREGGHRNTIMTMLY